MTEEIKNEDVKLAPAKVGEEAKDTVSKLFDERDQSDRDQAKAEETKEEKTPVTQKAEETPEPETMSKFAPATKAGGGESKPPEQKSDPKDDSKDEVPPEVEVLRKKLEKTEKTLAENHKYGRSNAQKVKNALKVVQKFADDGLLAEEEAKELYQTLYSEGEEASEENTHGHQNSPFAPIFKVANQELQNILKYTDDEHLQDKVNAFDYFLSVGSKEEIEQVLEDLTELLDDPLKLARKMLSIGSEVYEESYKGIHQAGGFKNYLSQQTQEIEKLQKKIDKLEKKLLQYEDFDTPRYRIDETGSPGTDASGAGGDVAGGKPANDTISSLFDERDKARRK